jgi:ribosome assembly protein 1
MDEYIYNPPPPPPPRDTVSSNTNKPRWQGNSGTRTKEVRSHPYRKAPLPDGPDGDLTSISPLVREASLDTAKWIADRKKNWPSAKRMEEKTKEKEQQSQKHQTATKGHDLEEQPSIGVKACGYFARGRCKYGSKCKYSHSVPQMTNTYKRFEAPVKGSLFTKLVQNDLDKENLKILEFISFLDSKGLI